MNIPECAGQPSSLNPLPAGLFRARFNWPVAISTAGCFFVKLQHMHDAVSLAPVDGGRWLKNFFSSQRVRALALTRAELLLSTLSAALLILSFPDFNLWPLAWVGLVPLMLAIARRPQLQARAFILGWLTGTLFFYGSCYWLTYAMVHYGGIPTLIAYMLLIPGALVVGLFPALFGLLLSRQFARWGHRALFCAPLAWAALEWARLLITGQLWNAIGYSQAYQPSLIQSSRWGGVYAVGFLIVSVNAALAYLLLRRTVRALAVALITVSLITIITVGLYHLMMKDEQRRVQTQSQPAAAEVIALQPNVPMEPVESLAETQALVTRHLDMSAEALRLHKDVGLPRVVIWPESPMNFMYARDSEFRLTLERFTKENRTSVIFNSLEPAPNQGSYNSALMVNEEGRAVAQYDKIHLLPFGEYVPLPRWLPGVNVIPVMVGDFTAGTNYPLLPLGEARAGIFICFESAFPSIARRFTDEGADVLINISNDGYLGPTPVLRQHLANAVFRAVENERPVLRVTNTGITAYINERGAVSDATAGYQTAVRHWTVRRAPGGKTFYTKHGDLFVGLCAATSLLLLLTWGRGKVGAPPLQ